MPENRKFVYGGFRLFEFQTNGHYYFLRKLWKFRNAFRKKLDPLNNHNEWLVSDIVEDRGSIDDYIMYYFIVRHMDGAGTPTGPEWLFIFSQGNIYNGNSQNQLSASCGSYFYNMVDSSSWSQRTLASALSTAHIFYILYNPFSGLGGANAFNSAFIDQNNLSNSTYSMIQLPANYTSFTIGETLLLELNSGSWATAIYRGRQDAKNSACARLYVENLSSTDLKLGGIIKDQATESKTTVMQSFNYPWNHWNRFYVGDFIKQTITGTGTSIYNWTSFVPSGTPEDLPYGFTFYGYFRADTDWKLNNQMVFIFDWNKPFIAFYCNKGHAQQSSLAAITGKIVVPYYPGGSQNGSLGFTFHNNNYSLPAGIFSYYTCSISDMYDPGKKYSYSKSETGIFARYWNSRIKSGGTVKFPYNEMQLYNSYEMKGYYDTDVFRESGSQYTDLKRVFTGPQGPFIKLSQRHMFPWSSDAMMIPPIPYDLEDFSEPGGILDDFDY